MQALFESSEEASSCAGLGIFSGTIRRFPVGLKVPHMGWNEVEAKAGSRLFQGIVASPFVYFAHSYYLPVGNRSTEMAAALCDYGQPFVAAIERENILGVQFHPEKSGALGLQVVANFAAICGEQVRSIIEQGGARAG
jgi:imidazole glycerol phosphate synthase glutamine amidotransferase subunit